MGRRPRSGTLARGGPRRSKGGGGICAAGESISLKTPYVVIIAISFVVTSARAKERAAAEWQLDVKTSYVVLGTHAARATGGIMPSVTGLRIWPVGEAAGVGLGADVGLFGLGGAARWIGVLGGPTAVAQITPASIPFAFELSARFDFGRIPVCNEWGLCLRYIGFFPALEPGVAYLWTQHLAISATCGARIIQTLAWSGFTLEPALAGRVFW